MAHRVEAHPRADRTSGPSRNQPRPARLPTLSERGQAPCPARRNRPGHLEATPQARTARHDRRELPGGDLHPRRARERRHDGRFQGPAARRLRPDVVRRSRRRLLAPRQDRGDLVPELTDIRRFSSDWEKAASVELRRGTRLGHRRLRGPRPHHRRRARDPARRHLRGVEGRRRSRQVEPDDRGGQRHCRRAEPARTSSSRRRRNGHRSGLAIADGQTAGRRRRDRDPSEQPATDRRQRAGSRTATASSSRATNPDGTMAVRRSSGGAEVVLPADYVAQHVELGYATTAYRSQGRTVDTTHSMVSPTTTREVLYVAATRGRESNTPLCRYRPSTRIPRRDMTAPSRRRARARCSPACSRTRVRTFPRTRPSNVHNARQRTSPPLAAEYETLARAAQQQRWDELLARSGLGSDRLEQVRQSPAYGPLLATLRDAEAPDSTWRRTFPVLVGSPFAR